MTGCLTVGTAVLHLALGSFTLSWTHSVEHVAWQEDWRINGHMLTLERSRLKGSGAGMEPGPDAVLKDGWWVSTGHLEVPALMLAASGATGAGWTFCADGQCRVIGADRAAPIKVAPCKTEAVKRTEPVPD
ncbi:DUF1850 domain-containing protein [Pseudosulfitobacter pseudonitzschiae]|uniref:DUF1850 domain-containing protein n=1 Tax=Pseudosulfitobacter pseudonitzschiae TaxID=1402135 RepID=A0A073IZ28_9RHOB|nr:DUF1850 domain-containing protein [Pseudosulfitobacter pseudonitzschiae]KEJ95598.1 hypothetical protein SUH3_21680 [Pseudosulfitobacter pseudonitzschiae]MBM1817975.1 DUF1850 domain-containing protein [Pseudosulfitobacter pseudonitzschiae]MBM1835033.1 DUF1850 domain-containing protein [Pseudosulfitobacter pseudonitzschiae]MBM1839834.1 DUF1850 domain-containing protein [Pseudosulfitobacter pseudonitzschiae]MBM1844750.1 DUF1850 domain-containing protein [Pseudosulfitobacter pseudonitzschiae]